MKFKKEDIVFPSEGAQLKAAILGKYGSVKEFVSSVEISHGFFYSQSYIDKECRSKKMTNQTLKFRLTQLFGIGYDEIILSEREQVRQFALNIFSNAQEYKDSKDIEVLDYVKDLCYKYSLDVEYGLMHRNIGFYYYNLNKIDSAVRMFNVCTELLEKQRQYNYLVLCLSDLGLIYLYQADYEKAMGVFEKADGFLSRCIGLDENYLYFYYYRKGIVLSNINRNEEARHSLEQALTYTTDKYFISAALNNIGVAWKFDGNYNKALEYYFKALDVICDTDVKESLKKSNLYNNIAELYRTQGELLKALENIELSFRYDPKIDMECTYTYFFTYFQIKSEMGDELSIIDQLINIVDSIDSYVKNKSYVIKIVNIIIGIYEKTNNRQLFDKLSGVLYKLIINADSNPIFTNELRACLGELYFYKMKGGNRIV